MALLASGSTSFQFVPSGGEVKTDQGGDPKTDHFVPSGGEVKTDQHVPSGGEVKTDHTGGDPKTDHASIADESLVCSAQMAAHSSSVALALCRVLCLVHRENDQKTWQLRMPAAPADREDR